MTHNCIYSLLSETNRYLKIRILNIYCQNFSLFKLFVEKIYSFMPFFDLMLESILHVFEGPLFLSWS